MAEIELSALSSQCPDRRIPNKKSLKTQMAPWQRGETLPGLKKTGVLPKMEPESSWNAYTYIIMLTRR